MSLFGKYSGVRMQPPRNTGMAHIAQQRLDHVAAQANKQQEEALRVDGSRIQHWAKSERGSFCTCQNLKKDDFAPFSSVHTNEKVTAELNSNDDLKPTFIVRGGRLQNKPNPKFEGSTDITQNKDLRKPDVRNVNTVNPTLEDLELPSGESELNDLLALLDQGDDSAFMFGGEGSQCGICFGTGYVEGYTLTNGQRFILEASGAHCPNLDAGGFTLDKSKLPNVFVSELNKNNYVVWTNVELPTYFRKCRNLVVRNNTRPCESAVIEGRIGAAPFAELTTDVLNGLNGQATKMDIRVRCRNSRVEGLCEFTHVEFTYQYSDWFLAQIPPRTPAQVPNSGRQIVNTEMVLSSKIPNLKTGDVIYEDKYDQLYKVNDVTDFVTQKGTVMGWNGVNMRMLQRYEALSLLRLAYGADVAI